MKLPHLLPLTLVLAVAAPSVSRAEDPPETTPPAEPPSPPPAEPRTRTLRPAAASPAQTPPATASPEQSPPDSGEIVRAQAGDWGMFFRFGGLATMTTAGDPLPVPDFLITQVGMRAVLSESSVIPFHIGAGVRSRNPEGLGDAQVDVGIDLGVDYEYHFRIWRRISPFFGFGVGFGWADPAGQDNASIGLGFGPSMGVEYYIADRVSLIAQYLLTFQLQILPGQGTQIAFSTLSGGALTLVFYF